MREIATPGYCPDDASPKKKIKKRLLVRWAVGGPSPSGAVFRTCPPCPEKGVAPPVISTQREKKKNKMEPEPNLPAMPAPLPVLAPMPLDGQVPTFKPLFSLSFVAESPSATNLAPFKKRVDERRRKHTQQPRNENTRTCVVCGQDGKSIRKREQETEGETEG